MLSPQKVKTFIDNPWVHGAFILLIIINSISLGLETSQTIVDHIGPILHMIDRVVIKIFVLELALRFYAEGWSFFRRPWNLFDFVVVGISLMPAGEAFAALRALRVLRILRLISAVPAMRRVIEGLLTAIPGIASVSCIIVLFFYVFAVIGTHLYGAAFPEWFGTLGETTFTLFQVMTLEGWSNEVARPVMEKFPSAWLFFISYIMITTFTMLNLFIAIIVNAMSMGNEEEAEESRDEMKKELLDEIKALEARLLEAVKKS